MSTHLDEESGSQTQTPPGSHSKTAVATIAGRPPIAFGPIPSRRLGHSLGINNIPPKSCSYSCLYCQVGPTIDRRIEPHEFYSPERIASEVAEHVAEVRARGEPIDHLTFSPDGEPTLDAGLGEAIRLLRPLEIPVAVICNGSLLWRPEVRARLAEADWVSVKVDAVVESIWRKVDRPHPHLQLEVVLDGVRRFAAEYQGELVSETMLVDGVNDGVESVTAVGEFLQTIAIRRAYVLIPTRPTPYPDVTAPDEATVTRAYRLLSVHVPSVECLIGYEGDAFASTGDPLADLLAITAVHPMRPSAVQKLLDGGGVGWDEIDRLVDEGALAKVEYRGEHYYVRRWR